MNQTTGEDKAIGHEHSELFDIGSLFRGSAIITFVVQILSVIVMLGSLAAFYIGRIIPGLSTDIQILLLLMGSILALIIFLAAISIFIRFSRRISDAVTGPGLQTVRLDTPRVKTVVYIYAILVVLMGVTGFYTWWLIDKNIVYPLIEVYNSISLRLFTWAMGAFFIALLIQIIIAGVGRNASRIITEVLDADDSEFTK
ncbi:MAG: hypothetical protein C4K47_00145 [Candidatus Thorarchaeota archaeon]|nr:MAG: hypothetical protein C4K47_00145 [Candidatus Thorarchaeota archaeon]